MAQIADDVAKGSAPPFHFALEAELRPIERLIARLRRSDRVTETRQAVRFAARRIEELARSANREDVAQLAGSLDAYFGHGDLLGTIDSFVDAQVVCATVDVLNAKLPGAFNADVADLQDFVNSRFQTRCEAAIVKSQEPEPIPPAHPDVAEAPWTAVDDAIDRAYEAHLSDADISLEPSEPVAEVPQDEFVEEAHSASAEEMERMIAEAFPEIERQPDPIEQIAEPPAKRRRGRKGKKQKAESFEALVQQPEPISEIAEPIAEITEPVAELTEPVAESQPDFELPPVEAVIEAPDEAAVEPTEIVAEAQPEIETPVIESVVEAPAEIAEEIVVESTVEPVVEATPEPVIEATPIPEVVAEAPTKSRRGRKAKADKKAKEKAPEQPRHDGSLEVAAEAKAVEPAPTPVEETTIAPAIPEVAAFLESEPSPFESQDFIVSQSPEAIVDLSMLPKSGDSVLDRVPSSTMLDGWDLAAADRDAWLEDHRHVLDNLRKSYDAVKANPADSDAMLELAAAFDDYRHAARQANRVPAADLAGKLGELPWRLAEQHAEATPETIDLLRLGVRGLIDLATGFYEHDQLQSLFQAVEQRLAAAVDSTPNIEFAPTPPIEAVEAEAIETAKPEAIAEPIAIVEQPAIEVPELTVSEQLEEVPAVEEISQPVAEIPVVEETTEIVVEATPEIVAEETPLDVAPESFFEEAPIKALAEIVVEEAPAEAAPELVAEEVAPPPFEEIVQLAEEAFEPSPVVIEERTPAAPPPIYVGSSSSTNLLALYERETAELLDTLESSLALLASNGTNAEALDRAYVTAHTYVGAAATVGYTDCSRVAGHIESILERVLSETAILDEAGHDLVRMGVALLKGRSTHDALPSFVIAGFSEQCAEWVAAQEAGQRADAGTSGEAKESSAEDFAQAAVDEAEITAEEVPASRGAAFDLLAGVSDAELELPDVPAELLEVYTEEAEEHLKLINSGLDRLRTDPNNRELVQEVRRSAHTLKGAAGAVGLRAVAKLSHRMEDLLDELYEGARTVKPHVFDLLRRSTDMLGDLSSGVRSPASSKEGLNELFRLYTTIVNQPISIPVAEVAPPSKAEPVAAELAPAEQKPVEQPPALQPAAVDPGVDIAPARIAASAGPAEVPIWPAAAQTWNKVRFPATPAQEQNQTRRTGNMLRVPLERIDDLVRLVSELVINRTAFEQRMAEFVRLVEDLKGSSSRLRTTSVELQNEYEAKAHRTGRRDILGAAHASTTGDGRFAAGASTTGDGRFAIDFDALEFDRYTDFHLMTRALAESTGDVGTLSNELANLVGDFDALLNRQSRLSRAIQDRLMRTRMVALTSLAPRLDRTVRSTADSLGKKVDLEIRGEGTELDKTVLEEMIDPLLHLLRNCVDHGLEGPEDRRRAGKAEAGRIFIHAFYQGTQVVIQVGDDGRGIDPEMLRAAAVRNGFLQAAEAAEADVETLYQLLFAPGFSTAGEVSEISGRGVGLDIVRSRVAKLKGSVAVDSAPGKGTTFSIRLPMTLAIVRSLLVSANGKTFAIPIQAVSQIIRVEQSAVGKVADGRVIFHGGKVFSLFQLGKTLGVPPVKEEEPAVMPVLITYSGTREVAVQVDKIEAAREIVVKTLGTHLRRVHGMIGATLLGDGTVVPILNLPELYAKVRGESAAPAPARPTAFPVKPAGLQVMVVDDSVSVRRVVSTMIKGQGWTPIQAKDGLDALEQLQKSAGVPDAILLDVEMPRMSGYELLAALRSDDKFRKVPVVMVTSRAGDKHRRKAMELGASEYQVKPFLEDALVALLRKLTGVAAKA